MASPRVGKEWGMTRWGLAIRGLVLAAMLAPAPRAGWAAVPVVPTPSPATIEAETPLTQQIFDNAFRRMQSYPVPAYAIFTDTWRIAATTVGYGGQETSSVEVHRYAVRLSDGMENVSNPIPSGKLPPALILPEFLGPFAWTLRSSVHVAPPANGGGVAMLPDIAGLKTIATVVTVAKSPYRIDLVVAAGGAQTEDVDGRPAYHLRLNPTSDPRRHNLRDLWIDEHTYDLLKAHFVGMYAPTLQNVPSHTDVIVYFRGVLGCWVVSRALWTYLNPPASFAFDVQTDEIALPATLPDWLFDAAAYQRHETAGDPDYLELVLDRMRNQAGASPQPTTTPTAELHS
jgi:hypothetical protein